VNATNVRFEGSVRDYLERYFAPETAFASACGFDADGLRDLIAAGLAPAPSYVVADGHIASYVFGRTPTEDAPPGAWFARGSEAWVGRAQAAIAVSGREYAGARLHADFKRAYRDAMRAAHASEGAIPGFARDDGGFDDAAFECSFDAIWTHFLAGTFTLCVRDANDAPTICEKEVIQLRLVAATDNGAKRIYTATESSSIRALIARYLDASMPFSPAEYDRSSRRRLVADVLPHLDRV
jgi:hypothetical protein